MRFTLIILTTTIMGFSINTQADVLKWVDKNGNTHYSNKEKKSSRNKAKVIKFVEYESSNDIEQTALTSEIESSLVGNSFNNVSGKTASNKEVSNDYNDNASYNKGRESIDELAGDYSEINRIILDELNVLKSYIQRKSRNTSRNTKLKPEYTIAEYNQRCEEAREELIAPLRQEAIHSCMKMKHSMTSRTRDYCEEINEDFGDGGMNSHGFYIQRMFHSITECQEAYEAWDRRSRKMRGYSEE